MLLVMAVLFALVLLVTPAGFSPRYLAAIYLTFLELTLINALVVFFSAAVSPVLAAVLTVGVFVCGHLSESLRSFGQSLADLLLCRFG